MKTTKQTTPGTRKGADVAKLVAFVQAHTTDKVRNVAIGQKQIVVSTTYGQHFFDLADALHAFTVPNIRGEKSILWEDDERRATTDETYTEEAAGPSERFTTSKGWELYCPRCKNSIGTAYHKGLMECPFCALQFHTPTRLECEYHPAQRRLVAGEFIKAGDLVHLDGNIVRKNPAK